MNENEMQRKQTNKKLLYPSLNGKDIPFCVSKSTLF